LPWFTEAARRWTLLTLVLFQAGIAVSLRMNLFPFIMTLALVPHMTQSVWSRLTWKRTSATHTPKASFRHNHTVSLLAQYMGAALLSFFLLSNLASVTARIGFPAGLTFMESSLGLHQGWSMYAPPITQDMGLRITIELSNGKTVELEDGRRLLNRGRVQTGFPPLNPIWRDYRGGMYMESLSYSAGRGELSAFASWVKTRWEELHPGAPTVQKVRLERVEWSRQTPADLSTELLLEWQSPHPP
jgi:hypothetical protein